MTIAQSKLTVQGQVSVPAEIRRKLGSVRAPSFDTNVLVRLLVRDDPQQIAAAEDFVARGAWVLLVVLVETVRVLDAVFERAPSRIVAAVGTERLA